MQRVKGCRSDFSGEKKMPQVGAAVGAARVAGALGIQRAGVFGVSRILDVDAALAGEELSGPGVPRGQHAVEQIDPARH
jgi:hypothetical protein